MSRRPIHPLLPITPMRERMATGLALAGMATLAVLVVAAVTGGRASDGGSLPDQRPVAVGGDVFVQADDESHYYGPMPTPGRVVDHVIDNGPTASEVVTGVGEAGGSVVDSITSSFEELASEVGR